MALSRLTKLKAVNRMLATIGQAPVNTLTGSVSADVAIAKNVLDDITVEVLSEGWAFNTEYNFPLLANGDGEYLLPSNTLRIDADQHPQFDLVERDGKLYSRYKRTTQFSTDTLKVTFIQILEFDALPEYARRYIMIKSCRDFQDKMVGSDVVHQYTAQDEARARAAMMSADGDTGDYNIFNNCSTFRILDRRISHSIINY